MNLTLSSNPQILSAAAVTSFQDWSSQTETIFQVNTNTGVVAPQTIAFFIKDVVDVPAYNMYSAFRLTAVQYYEDNNAVNFVNPISYNDNGYPVNLDTFIDILANGLNYEFTPEFLNTQLLAPGTYKFFHKFIIQGSSSFGVWNDISTYIHSTTLIASNADVGVNPQILYFNHVLEAATPTQQITVFGNNWKVSVTNQFILTSAGSGVSIVQNSNGGYVASGSGTKTLVIGLNLEYFDTVTSFNIPELYSALILQNPNNIIGTLDIYVTVLDNALVNINPSSFAFTAVRFLSEPVLKYATISAAAAYTISHPAWLIVTEGNFYGGTNFLGNVTIVPIPTANMQPGIYTEDIVITYVQDGNTETINIPVTYNLQGLLINPYPANDVAFTLDNLFYEFNSELEQTYFNINSEIKVYNFITGESTIINANDKLPLANSKGKINFGKRIHSVMKRFNLPNNNDFQYKLAEFKMDVSEVYLETNSLIRSFSTEIQKFVAGLSIGTSIGATFLKINEAPLRVTKQAAAIVNMYLPAGIFQLKVYKNQSFSETINIETSAGGVFSKKVFFGNYTEGDFISYKIYDVLNDIEVDGETNFIVFPSSRYSSLLIWENIFLLQSAFEFTGAFNLKSDYEGTTQNKYIDLVEFLEILETKKVSKFTINTGWVLKSDSVTIDSIMRSKRVWLIKSQELIELRPISKSIIDFDSERETIDFAIEFQINRPYDEKNYSF